MRMMLTMKPGNVEGSHAVKDGRMEKTIGRVIETLRPEASYFYPEHGRRTAVFVFDLKEASQIPSILEPLWDEVGADIELVPVMNLDELKKGLDQFTRGRR